MALVLGRRDGASSQFVSVLMGSVVHETWMGFERLLMRRIRSCVCSGRAERGCTHYGNEKHQRPSLVVTMGRYTDEYGDNTPFEQSLGRCRSSTCFAHVIGGRDW